MTLQANETLRSREKITTEPHGYAAVPLDGWSARDPGNPAQLYTLASLDRIQQKTTDAIERLREHDWVAPDLEDTLQELIEVSLIDSQLQRVDRNSVMDAVDERGVPYVTTNEGDERVERARKGLATPSDLLTMLLEYPALGSAELAKLSHPLDSSATWAMDEAIRQTIIEKMGTLDIKPARYKTKTVIDGVPVITVLRKQQMASFDTLEGEVAIIRRQAFLVRADALAKDEMTDPYLDRKLRHEVRRVEEVYPKIEEFLPHLSEFPDLKWLQPLATSYYAKNVQTARNPRANNKVVTHHGE